MKPRTPSMWMLRLYDACCDTCDVSACNFSDLPLDSVHTHGQSCACIYTHFYIYVQVDKSHTLYGNVLMHQLRT